MPGPYATPPHRTRGSWTPRLAGIGVIVALAGGGLAFYLGTAHGQAPAVPAHHRPSPLASTVASVQTVGLVDFGVYDDGDGWRNDSDDHPMMLLKVGAAINFARIPPTEVVSGTPEWTADQLTDGGDIFIYIPTGQCLTAASGGKLILSRCDLAADQRWRTLTSEVILTEPIAQYANLGTGRCLTAPRRPGLALMTTCANPHFKRFKSQEIAFWWSALAAGSAEYRGQRSGVRGAQLGQVDGEQSADLERLASGAAEHLGRHPVGRAQLDERRLRPGPNLDDGASRRLAEQRGKRVDAGGQPHGAAGFADQAALGERDR